MSTHVKQYEWRLNNTALKTLCVHIYVFVYTIPYIGQENRTKQKKKKRERNALIHLLFYSGENGTSNTDSYLLLYDFRFILMS